MDLAHSAKHRGPDCGFLLLCADEIPFIAAAQVQQLEGMALALHRPKGSDDGAIIDHQR